MNVCNHLQINITHILMDVHITFHRHKNAKQEGRSEYSWCSLTQKRGIKQSLKGDGRERIG